MILVEGRGAIGESLTLVEARRGATGEHGHRNE